MTTRKRYAKKATHLITNATPADAAATVAQDLTSVNAIQVKESILVQLELGETMIDVSEDYKIAIDDMGAGYINIDVYKFVGVA